MFAKATDYKAFEEILEEVQERVDIRLLAYCLLPNCWQLLLWPRQDGDLSEYMRVAAVTHVQRWHVTHGTVGSGSLYNCRFTSFPVQKGEPLLSVCRYVESAAIRARKTKQAENWRWCSLWRRLNGSEEIKLARWPVGCPKNWKAIVNRPFKEDELVALDNSAQYETPYGTPHWQKVTANRLGLQSTLRRRGRPKKVVKQ